MNYPVKKILLIEDDANDVTLIKKRVERSSFW